MPKLTVTSPSYKLELDRDEAQFILNLVGGIGKRKYEALRDKSMRSSWPTWDTARSIISGLFNVLEPASGLFNSEGKVNP